MFFGLFGFRAPQGSRVLECSGVGLGRVTDFGFPCFGGLSKLFRKDLKTLRCLSHPGVVRFQDSVRFRSAQYSNEGACLQRCTTGQSSKRTMQRPDGLLCGCPPFSGSS